MFKPLVPVVTFLFTLCATGPASAASTEDFFRPLQYAYFTLNPAGTRVAGMVRGKDRQLVRIIDFERELSIDAIDTSDLEGLTINQFMWTDNNTLLVEMADFDRGGIIIATDLREDKEGRPVPVSSMVASGGAIIDPLIDHEDEFLYGFYTGVEENDAKTYSYAFRMHAWKKQKLLPRDAMAKKEGYVSEWFTDKDGEIRAVSETTRSGKTVNWYLNPDNDIWVRYWNNEEKVTWFTTVGVVSDKQFEVYVIGQGVDRDTAAVYEYRFTDDRLVELFGLDGYDVDDVIYDWQSRKVIGAIYYEDGVRRHHYFERTMQATHDAMVKIFGGESIEILGHSNDFKRVFFKVHSFTNPGQLYLFDRDTNQAMFLDDQAPWLEGITLQSGEASTVASADGLDIPYFLTLPADTSQAVPMVVMPHGGPLGVQDNLLYSNEVQFLVSHGYAVLQVNYRGSGGYGLEFLGAGAREWGEGIEQDIDTVVQHVVQTQPVDADNLAIVGSSYGGYSALVTVSGDDNRYKCAASFAGVTDIGLLFSSSDWNMVERSVELMKQLVGDPFEEYDLLAAKSPVYRAENIDVPVLIVHGDKDPRVDVEHAWRMRLALEQSGKAFDWLILEGEGHGIESLDNRVRYYDKLIEFLDGNLKSGPDDLAGK